MKFTKFKTYLLGILSIIFGIYIFITDSSEFDTGRIYDIPVFLLLTVFGKTGTLLIHILFGLLIIIFQFVKDKKQNNSR